MTFLKEFLVLLTNVKQGEDFGGFSGAAGGGTPTKGKDYKTEVQITLKEALKGTKRRIKINNQSIEIAIKPGTPDGHKMKLSGKGHPGQFGGVNGDLILSTKLVIPDDTEVKGSDLYISYDVPLLDAILGGKIEVNTIAGKFNLSISELSQQGKLMKLKGQGLPQYSDPSIKGDLYIKLNVILPSKLSKKEKSLFKELSDLRKK